MKRIGFMEEPKQQPVLRAGDAARHCIGPAGKISKASDSAEFPRVSGVWLACQCLFPHRYSVEKVSGANNTAYSWHLVSIRCHCLSLFQMPHTVRSLGTDTDLRPDLVLLMRPAVLGSPGRAPPENEPVVVKLEDTEEEEEGSLWDPGPEAARLRFRCFRYEEAIGPQEALAQLRELCHQWLRPEVHSKEQMLELLVLEQFLSALPPEIQAHVQGQWPGSPEEAAALVDRLRWELDGPRKWVSR